MKLELLPVPSQLRHTRHQIHDWLESVGCSTEEAADIALATNEAMTNAIEYSVGGHPVVVLASLVGDALQITVSNEGTWLRRPAPRPYRGRGLQIMRCMMDQVTVCDDGSTVAVELCRCIGGSERLAPR